IWAGPLREGHQNFDVNGFMIFKGGWLAGNTTIWSHSGILSATLNQNNLTFGGMGQAPQAPDARWPDEAGRTGKHEETAEYTYFAGWGAQAYVQDRSHGGIKIADDYTRKLVYVAPDLFLIYDRVSLVNPNLSKEWHLRTRNAIAVNGRSYRADNG